MHDLSEAFAPCTRPGLASALWQKNLEIGALNRKLYEARNERTAIEKALMGLMAKSGGEVVESPDHPPLRLAWGWDFDYVHHTGKRVPVLEFDKEPR